MINTLSMVEYEITFDPLENAHTNKTPKEIRSTITDMYRTLSEHPEETIGPLLDLLNRYPYVPVIRNLLASAYMMLDQISQAEVHAKDNYEKFPDYLFAKINLAQICIQKGELKRVPAIFNHKYELKLLYPSRKRFHITEFMSFMGLMSIYFYHIGDDERSTFYYQAMRQVDKNHPAVKQTKMAITPPLSIRVMRKLLGPAKAARLQAKAAKENFESGDGNHQLP